MLVFHLFLLDIGLKLFPPLRFTNYFLRLRSGSWNLRDESQKSYKSKAPKTSSKSKMQELMAKLKRWLQKTSKMWLPIKTIRIKSSFGFGETIVSEFYDDFFWFLWTTKSSRICFLYISIITVLHVDTIVAGIPCPWWATLHRRDHDGYIQKQLCTILWM